MQILTEKEYEELVEALVTDVWAPLGDSQDFVFEVSDLVDEGRQDEARERLYAKIHDAVSGGAKHITNGETMWLDDLPPVVHGCIIQHATEPCWKKRRARFEELHGSWGRSTDPESVLAREAFISLAVDVRQEVWSRVRAFVDDRGEE